MCVVGETVCDLSSSCIAPCCVACGSVRQLSGTISYPFSELEGFLPFFSPTSFGSIRRHDAGIAVRGGRSCLRRGFRFMLLLISVFCFLLSSRVSFLR